MTQKTKLRGSFRDAVADIPDGSTIGFGGFAMPGTPFNLIKALMEQGAKRLTLVANTTGGAQQPRMPDIGMLVENGQVAKVICAFTAATRPTDVLPFTKYYESGEVDAELVPQGTLAERLRAAGAGIPAFYTPAAVGTELAAGRETRVIDGREYLLEYALEARLRVHSREHGGYRRQPALPPLAAEFLPGDGNRGPVHDRRDRRGGRAGRRHRPGRRPYRRHLRASVGAGAAGTRGIVAHQTAGEKPMSETKGLTRQQMADRVAREFQDGWIVNLGVGIPTMCSNTDIGDRDITYHSENGVIGYGPVAAPGEEDLNLVNAGGQNVTLKPGAAVVHHADSFGVIRGGHIDATVMGAYQVSMTGDFANWKLKGQKGGGIGGAMDLAACAKRVFIILEHVTRNGAPRLVDGVRPAGHREGRRDAGRDELWPVRADRLRLPAAGNRSGVEVDEIRVVTGGTLTVADGLRAVKLEN